MRKSLIIRQRSDVNEELIKKAVAITAEGNDFTLDVSIDSPMTEVEMVMAKCEFINQWVRMITDQP